jgi:hypothetical protein
MSVTRMSAFSTEELRGQIAAGRYAVDSRALAEAILTKSATIRRVRRVLMSEDGAIAETGQPAQRRSRRGGRAASAHPRQSRTQRLS